MDAKIVNSGIVYRNNLEEKRYNAWPTVAKTDDGKLVVVFSGNRAAHICPFGKDLMCVSDAKNIDFKGYRTVVDTLLDDRDPGILNMGNGRFLLSWFSTSAETLEKHRFDDLMKYIGNDERLRAETISKIAEYKNYTPEQRRGGAFYRLSSDNCVTWGEPKRIPVSAPHGPILLSDGTVFYLGKVIFDEEDRGQFLPYLSKDGGLTWRKGGIVPVPEGLTSVNLHEAHAVELADGTIFAIIRAENITSDKYPIKALTMFKCYSYDKGETWTVPEYMDICGAPPHLMLHSSGALICAFSRRESVSGIKAIVSYDNGKTFSGDFFISDIPIKGGDLGYPASVELDDGSIFTVFYQRYADDNRTSICYSTWQIEK